MITEKQKQAIEIIKGFFDRGTTTIHVNNASKPAKAGEDFTIEALDHMNQELGLVFVYESARDELIISKEA